MQRPDPLDDYFTDAVVGPAVEVSLGPRSSLRQASDQGVLLEGAGDRLRLLGALVRGLWRHDPQVELAGLPVIPAQLPRLRKRLLLGLLLLWSLLLGGALWFVFLKVAA